MLIIPVISIDENPGHIYFGVSNNKQRCVFLGRKPVSPVQINPIKPYTICNFSLPVYSKNTTLKNGRLGLLQILIDTDTIDS